MASPEALCGRLQINLDLKSKADQYYKMWRSEAHRIPKATFGNVQAVALHEGEWHSHGAVKTWNYTIGGKSESFKEQVVFDDDNLTFTLKGMEGRIFDLYKAYYGTCKLVPKSKGCVAKLAIEYERLNGDAPIPNHYMDFFVNLTKEIDSHACAASV